jgi:hypothetical protein
MPEKAEMALRVLEAPPLLTADKQAAIGFADWYPTPDFSSAFLVSLDEEGFFGEAGNLEQLAREQVHSVEELCARGDEEEAADNLLDFLEGELRVSRFDVVNATLEAIAPNDVTVGVTLVALTITSYARDHLAARADFVDRAEKAFRRKVGSARAKALLATRR